MRYMATYDMMETLRNTNQWLGATAEAMASYPAFAMWPNPGMTWLAAWGSVTERSFERMVAKPDWGIHSITCDDGRDHLVNIRTEVSRPFGDLIHFEVAGRARWRARFCWLRRCPDTMPRSSARRFVRCSLTVKSMSPIGTMHVIFLSRKASSTSRTTPSIWWSSCDNLAPTPM